MSVTAKIRTFAASIAVVAQLVEHQLPKLRVAGSSPVYRSNKEKGLEVSEDILISAVFLLLKTWYSP